jgi:hypothetical protein
MMAVAIGTMHTLKKCDDEWRGAKLELSISDGPQTDKHGLFSGLSS